MTKIDKLTLENLYLEKTLPIKEIADFFKVGIRTVFQKIEDYNIPRRGQFKLKAYSGRKFGRLTLLKESFIDNKKNTQWECLCDCGNVVVRFAKTLNNGGVKSCGCWKKERTGNKSPFWKGCGEISQTFFLNIINKAKKRNLEFNITIEQIWDLYLKQNKKCKLSGIEIKFSTTVNGYKLRGETSASLDRIDSSKGYLIDNIQWVHKRINWMKSNLSDDEFVYWCKKVSENSILYNIINLEAIK